MKPEYMVGAGVGALMIAGAAVFLLAPKESVPPPSPPPPPLERDTPPEVVEDADGPAARIATLLERAAASEDEAAANAELDLALDELAASDGLANARALLDPEQPARVQEVGVRLLAELEGEQAAFEQARAVADPKLAAQARLLLVYALDGREDDATRGALWALAENREDDNELRAFALSVVAGPDAKARLLKLVQAAEDDPLVRAHAFLALHDLDAEAAAAEREALTADPAVAKALEGLESE